MGQSLPGLEGGRLWVLVLDFSCPEGLTAATDPSLPFLLAFGGPVLAGVALDWDFLVPTIAGRSPHPEPRAPLQPGGVTAAPLSHPEPTAPLPVVLVATPQGKALDRQENVVSGFFLFVLLLLLLLFVVVVCLLTYMF